MKFNFNPLSAQFELQAGNCNTSSGGAAQTFASVPVIQNIPIANADEEVVITLPVGTRKLMLKVRNYSSTVKFSYSQGDSGTNYMTITRGCSYSEDNILTVTGNTKIYIQSTKPNVVIECLTWA
jgi:hypothetical protein